MSPKKWDRQTGGSKKKFSFFEKYIHIASQLCNMFF